VQFEGNHWLIVIAIGASATLAAQGFAPVAEFYTRAWATMRKNDSTRVYVGGGGKL
jgi:hypothetical protein